MIFDYDRFDTKGGNRFQYLQPLLPGQLLRDTVIANNGPGKFQSRHG